jgi:hypothetical protein
LITSVETFGPRKLLFVAVLLVSAAVGFAQGLQPVSGGNQGNTTQPVISSTGQSGANNGPTVGTNSPGNSASSNNSASNSSANNVYGQPQGDSASKELGPGDDYSDMHKEDEHSVSATAKRSRPQAKEKVIEIDSVSKLRSSGVDKKFQGSLIDNVDPANRINLTPRTTTPALKQEDPRFTAKHLSLVDQLAAEDNKKASTRLFGDSPSPSPSASGSPSPDSKKSADQNR